VHIFKEDLNRLHLAGAAKLIQPSHERERRTSFIALGGTAAQFWQALAQLLIH